MATSIEFILGDKLPWLHEAVLAIYSYAPGGSPKEGKESKIRKQAINAYTNSIMKIWVKAFGLENVAPRITVVKKIRSGLESHFNSVLCKGRSTLSKRERLRQWRESPNVNCLLDILKTTSDPKKFDDNEKLFYFAQKAHSR